MHAMTTALEALSAILFAVQAWAVATKATLNAIFVLGALYFGVVFRLLCLPADISYTSVNLVASFIARRLNRKSFSLLFPTKTTTRAVEQQQAGYDEDEIVRTRERLFLEVTSPRTPTADEEKFLPFEELKEDLLALTENEVVPHVDTTENADQEELEPLLLSVVQSDDEEEQEGEEEDSGNGDDDGDFQHYSDLYNVDELAENGPPSPPNSLESGGILHIRLQSHPLIELDDDQKTPTTPTATTTAPFLFGAASDALADAVATSSGVTTKNATPPSINTNTSSAAVQAGYSNDVFPPAPPDYYPSLAVDILHTTPITELDNQKYNLLDDNNVRPIDTTSMVDSIKLNSNTGIGTGVDSSVGGDGGNGGGLNTGSTSKKYVSGGGSHYTGGNPFASADSSNVNVGVRTGDGAESGPLGAMIKTTTTTNDDTTTDTGTTADVDFESPEKQKQLLTPLLEEQYSPSSSIHEVNTPTTPLQKQPMHTYITTSNVGGGGRQASKADSLFTEELKAAAEEVVRKNTTF